MQYISFLNTQILCFCSMLVHIKPKFKSFVNYVLALRLAKTTKLFCKSASNLAETTSSSKFNFLFLQNFHQAKLFLQSGANLPRIYLYLQVEISKNILSSVKWQWKYFVRKTWCVCPAQVRAREFACPPRDSGTGSAFWRVLLTR